MYILVKLLGYRNSLDLLYYGSGAPFEDGQDPSVLAASLGCASMVD